MTSVYSAAVRAANHLQHFYHYLAPRTRQPARASRIRATVHHKRSFVG